MDSNEIVNASPLDGPNVSVALGNAVRPFRATYYVDPASTTTFKNGSQAFPFTTVQAAFAAAVAAGYAGAIVYLPPKTTLTENVIFPDGGGSWEIASLGDGLADRSTINGTLVCSSLTQSFFTLRGIALSGALSGDATSAAGNFLYLRDSTVGGNLLLTGTGSGVWFADFIGSGSTFFAFGGACLGTCSVIGQLLATDWYFTKAISAQNGPNFFTNCRFINGSLNTPGIGSILRGCDLTAPMVVTGTPGGFTVFNLDGYTATEALRVGVTLNNVAMKTLASNLSARRVLNNNQGGVPFNGNAAAHQPPGLYECTAAVDLITASGGAGIIGINVTYTDMNGVQRTKQFCSLVENGSGGTEANGSIRFNHNGATSITYSILGIAVPVMTSYNLGIALRRVD